jgi:ribosomal protein S18 acetylase RimI-like enzyme
MRDDASAMSPLDNPVYAALRGPHRTLAQGRGRVLRYPSEFARFIGMPDAPTARDWADLQDLLVGDPGAVMVGDLDQLPTSVTVVRSFEVVQMVADDSAGPEPASTTEVVALTEADVPDMVELVRRTEPGPFADRTADLGAYFGIRREGVLVAMAGQRLRPPGWTELSAVCTHPDVRGQGLAGQVIAAVTQEARERGDRLFLHVVATNTVALEVYRRLRYRERRRVAIAILSNQP